MRAIAPETPAACGELGVESVGWVPDLAWSPGLRRWGADVYGDDFLAYDLKTFRLMEDWHRPLDEFDVAYVLLERSNPLSTLLATSVQWREAYADDVARIFVRTEMSRFAGRGLSTTATSL